MAQPSPYNGINDNVDGVQAEVNALLKECNALITYWSSGEARGAAEMLADAKTAIKLYTARDAALKAAKTAAASFNAGAVRLRLTDMGKTIDKLEELANLRI